MTTVDRYQIKRELGRECMAAVYLAFDPRFDREAAIAVDAGVGGDWAVLTHAAARRLRVSVDRLSSLAERYRG